MQHLNQTAQITLLNAYCTKNSFVSLNICVEWKVKIKTTYAYGTKENTFFKTTI